MKLHRLSVRLLFSLVLGAGLWANAPAQSRAAGSAPQEGDFFIISSVDASKQQMLLKLPTEVTEVMLTTKDALFFDEQGKPMRFQDLRAGDTVYVVSKLTPDGTHVASRVRRGPMTIEELRRRYLKSMPSGES